MLQRKGNRPLGGVELPGLLLGPTGSARGTTDPKLAHLLVSLQRFLHAQHEMPSPSPGRNPLPGKRCY